MYDIKKKIKVQSKKNIALVAHDYKKDELLNWVKKHRKILQFHHLMGTGTTATIIEEHTGLNIEKFASGPLGGDQQLGAKISESEIDVLIFFWDPLEMQPHDPDVKALLRISTLYNIAIGTCETTADYIISSPMFTDEYEVEIVDNNTNIKNRVESVEL
ncbi:methylglyoxal synthase [Anaerosphaera multitolerans]|uniref:Methylglyoxal synthase n=1 Tax=Anaerosphaera multitolerans TaxID=2487351 RepID=A0A437S7M2_9FIRM|nr:methylglyoxal synthase [Anaerosphaera multitolerans]RVU55075.1 methylglyoxal synthase [Anaerosphaera multitolerans]